MFKYSRDLKPILKKIGMKQKELAEILGKSERTIKHWVAGVNSPAYDTHLKVMEILNIDESDFTNMSIKVPVLSYVQAGEFTLSSYEIDPIKYVNLPANLIPKNGFLLEVKGNSMNYDYSDKQKLDKKYAKYSLNEGETIIVDPNDKNIINLVGKVIVAKNSDGATVKLVYIENGKLCLMPLNSNFQNNDEIKQPYEAEIIGRVINVFRSF
ncbi:MULTISPECIES: LexA family protein [Francisella]|uniref:Helix-turn-helix domain-containing protein n=1 Tax=Francisella opportunistica TaxID=2016517 RepID=A0A345JTI4_9GAMM|nr:MULTISPECIES: S24 family peptidase [Francisella]APC92428.1 SOS-response repressor and protease LexA [Francisella sp. MA067296]AXH30630.1 helix-turn-helix domain-containing protein [Francisella opportunistica]AXH32270.1 LexA family transcriptional repressor [Francisella opportunistica]AXH33919.1 LexA family transcriptional repressor [Francisella opportunistica]